MAKLHCSVWHCHTKVVVTPAPADDKHQISLLIANGAGLCTMVIPYVRQRRKLQMVKKEEGMEKQQLTRAGPVPTRSTADPLAAESWSLPASINP